MTDNEQLWLNEKVRIYWKLLRLPYQFLLAPIFGWGFFLAGGQLHETAQWLHFTIIFLCFHIGCFGGLTALNFFYDKDTTPVGGMQQPPKPPRFLWHFAWLTQLLGVLPLLWLDIRIAAIYIAIVVLALGYSHPKTRWKKQPQSSLVVVAIGQGVLDCFAGALTAQQFAFSEAVLVGCCGAAALVCAWYPLTQLFQVEEDARRGDETIALRLIKNGGRTKVFRWTREFYLLGTAFNLLALLSKELRWDTLLFSFATIAVLFYLRDWSRRGNGSVQNDFRRVHLLLRVNASAFAIYLAARLIS